MGEGGIIICRILIHKKIIIFCSVCKLQKNLKLKDSHRIGGNRKR